MYRCHFLAAWRGGDENTTGVLDMRLWMSGFGWADENTTGVLDMRLWMSGFGWAALGM